jgi:hypothetical protein
MTVFAATLFGAALGLRYNAWALLLCLGATVFAMSATMTLWAGQSVAATAIATIAVIAAVQIGYLLGAVAAQVGIVRRTLRLMPSPLNQ